jgi:hypothetical protein
MASGTRAPRPNSFYCCFTWIGGVDLRYGSTADQGRTGREDSSSRLWRPARALGTHAKQGPSTGHSAVGLRQAEKCLLTPRPHFTAPSCTLGNQVVRASDGPPFRQERRPSRRPHRSLPHRATPATVYQARPKANPGTRTDTHDRVQPTASMRPAPSRCAWPAACTTSASAEPTPEPTPEPAS